jgi:hypothetical protein
MFVRPLSKIGGEFRVAEADVTGRASGDDVPRAVDEDQRSLLRCQDVGRLQSTCDRWPFFNSIMSVSPIGWAHFEHFTCIALLSTAGHYRPAWGPHGTGAFFGSPSSIHRVTLAGRFGNCCQAPAAWAPTTPCSLSPPASHSLRAVWSCY